MMWVMKTEHTYNYRDYDKYPDRLPGAKRGCDCNVISINYLMGVETGVTWCTKCNVLYEKQPGPDQVITMFKDVKRGQSPDRSKALVVWNSAKSVGHSNMYVTDNIVEVIPAVAQVLRDPAIFITPETKTNRQSYEEAYWKFVNSTTYDDAVKYKKMMEEYVDLSLEPDGENWSSWVKDPEISAELKEHHGKLAGFGHFMFTMTMLGLILVWILFVVEVVIGLVQ